MIALIPGLGGALVVAGLIGVATGMRKSPERPIAPTRMRLPLAARMGGTSPRTRALLIAGVGAGLLTALLTGWLVAALLVPAVVVGLPILLSAPPAGSKIERVEALEEWTRSLSGVLTVGVGLEQALIATLRSTPDAIRPEVTHLVARLRARWGTEDALRAFATQYGIQFWLQSAGPDSAEPFFPTDAPPLYYSLPEFGVQIHFRPTDFTQVNHAVNRILVRHAMNLLDPRPGEHIADLFCGLGNFSLPIASRGAHVLGVEGNAELVRRAEDNARKNGLAARARFQVANLFEAESCAPFGANDGGGFDKLLIDPPRDGAVEVVKALGESGPRRIVYVSCDPATLARDAEVLVQVKGYRLAAAGVINMFPHTSHVESMALFEK